MDFYMNLKTAEDKLAKVLVEENLVHTFRTNTYPITLIVSQDCSPEAQMDLLATADDGKSSSDAVLKLIFNLDGLKIQTDSRFVITDALMGKIKGHAKKMYLAYLEGFFAECCCGDTAPTQDVSGPAAPDCVEDDPDAFADFMGEAEPAEETEGEE